MKPLFLKLLLLSCLSIFMYSPVYAVLDLELTKGIDSGIPIAVTPFISENQRSVLPVDMGQVVAQDLAHSGRFIVLDSENSTGNTEKINVA